jgi:hypothetical protein
MIQEVETQDNRLLRMKVSEYRGETYISFAHMWRKDPSDTEWKFSKQVINIPIEKKEEFKTAIENFLQSL